MNDTTPMEVKDYVKNYVDETIKQAMSTTHRDPNDLGNIKIKVKQLHKRIDATYNYYQNIIKELKY